MEGNILRDKSYAFALKVIGVYRYLSSNKNEFVLSKQLLRSGTSIGANIEESIGGYSEKDFSAKLSIAYKEARETHYWIRLLKDTNLLTENQTTELLDNCDELIRITGKILSTMRKKQKYQK
ncbi:MAG: four helix bundle protein [Candidatus Shapirobacteria bacterium]|jgi:four helix bundle protein